MELITIKVFAIVLIVYCISSYIAIYQYTDNDTSIDEKKQAVFIAFAPIVTILLAIQILFKRQKHNQ